MIEWWRHFARASRPLPLSASICCARCTQCRRLQGRSGFAVRPWRTGSRRRCLAKHEQQPELTDPRVEIPARLRVELTELRRDSGVTNRALCAAVGIRQPVTFYAWEKSDCRARRSTHFEAYLNVIGANAAGRVEQDVGRTKPSGTRLERTVQRLRPKRRARLRASMRPRCRGSAVVRFARGSAADSGALRSQWNSAICCSQRRTHGIARLLSGRGILLGSQRNSTLDGQRQPSALPKRWQRNSQACSDCPR